MSRSDPPFRSALGVSSAVLLITLVAACARATPADQRPVVAIYVTAECKAGACPPKGATATARGSGVAIGRDRDTGGLLILTAAHVVRDTEGIGQVKAYVGSQWRAARVRAVTQKTPNWDLALVEVDYPQDWPCVSLEATAVGAGSEVNLCGYEGGLRWVHKRGLFGRRDTYWLYWNGATPREGTSGGALLANGALIAIITGYTNDAACLGVGQNSAAIAVFLREALGYIPGEANYPSTPQQPPATAPAGGSDQTAALSQQISALRAELQAVKNRPITVEIFDPETGTVKSRSFPAGEPIRLKLPARRESHAGTS